MFNHLKRFSVILVTGPHRSGTTIAANMIASDLGYMLMYEEDVVHRARILKQPEDNWQWFFNLNVFFAEHYERRYHTVFQCPSHCRYVDTYAGQGHIGVVMMHRNPADILRSQKRIKWNFDKNELKKYDAPKYAEIAHVKYNYWNRIQRDKLLELGQAIDLDYESLSSHPFWVPKEKRVSFHSRQIRIGERRGQPYLTDYPVKVKD